mgnify:CR=1 FL=1
MINYRTTAAGAAKKLASVSLEGVPRPSNFDLSDIKNELKS